MTAQEGQVSKPEQNESVKFAALPSVIAAAASNIWSDAS
jgi:hypothetical protein